MLTGVSGVGPSSVERISRLMAVAAERMAVPANAHAKADEEMPVPLSKPAQRPTPLVVAAEGTRKLERIADAVDEVSDTTVAAAAKAAPDGDELGRLWLHAFNAQVDDGMSTLKGMVVARSISDVLELQTRFLSQSVGRMAELQSRSLARVGRLAGNINGAARRAT